MLTDSSSHITRLRLAGAILLAVTGSALASNPAQLDLTGIIRDFTSSHPDFNVTASAGNGHYAGNIDLALGADNRPVYVGGGRKVTTEWTDAAGNPNAPHLYNVFAGTCGGGGGTAGIAADGLVSINNQAVVDSFDSSLGPYGGGNVGSAATVSTNATGSSMFNNTNSSDIHGDGNVGPGGNPGTVYSTSPNSTISGTITPLVDPVPMPVIVEPTGLGPSIGDVEYNSAVTISSDMHVDQLKLKARADVTISGNVTILCEEDFIMNQQGGSGNAQITLAPNSTLDLYIKGNGSIIGDINYNTGNPALCRIYKLGPGGISITIGVSHVVARIFVPEGSLSVRQGAEVFGTFIGSSFDLDNQAEFHMDVALAGGGGGGGNPADSPGQLGVSSSGGIDSAASFDQWYRDVVGVNQSMAHVISLQLAGGVYEYSTATFHPIDDSLLGNEGDPNNQYFTYAIDARFVYEACNGQWLEFEGDDDAWAFIDGQLVMDLGGTAPGTSQYVDLDRFGLADGQTYQMLLLYAQRQPSASFFRLRTNIVLSTHAVVPTVSAAFD